MSKYSQLNPLSSSKEQRVTVSKKNLISKMKVNKQLHCNSFWLVLLLKLTVNLIQVINMNSKWNKLFSFLWNLLCSFSEKNSYFPKIVQRDDRFKTSETLNYNHSDNVFPICRFSATLLPRWWLWPS